MNKEAERRIRERLAYDPETGVLTWKVRAPHASIEVGDEAGCVNQSTGYKRIGINGKYIGAHCLAWFLYYGRWPKDQLDHIDNTKANNRITNLRECSHSENQHNRPLFRNNTSGVKGVCYNKRNRKWIARVAVDGKRCNIGYFKDMKDAESAVIKKREELHKEFANNN